MLHLTLFMLLLDFKVKKLYLYPLNRFNAATEYAFALYFGYLLLHSNFEGFEPIFLNAPTGQVIATDFFLELSLSI